MSGGPCRNWAEEGYRPLDADDVAVTGKSGPAAPRAVRRRRIQIGVPGDIHVRDPRRQKIARAQAAGLPDGAEGLDARLRQVAGHAGIDGSGAAGACAPDGGEGAAVAPRGTEGVPTHAVELVGAGVVADRPDVRRIGA